MADLKLARLRTVNPSKWRSRYRLSSTTHFAPMGASMPRGMDVKSS